MELRIATGEIGDVQADAVLVGVPKGATLDGGAAGRVDAGLDGELAAVLAAGDFEGKLGEVLTLYSRGRLAAPRVLAVGLGPTESVGLDEMRRAAASGAAAAHKMGVTHLAMVVSMEDLPPLDVRSVAQAMVEGATMALYLFRAYKRQGEGDDDQKPEMAVLTLLDPEARSTEQVRAGAAVGEALAAGIALARDLANHPSNVATPSYLASQAADLAARHQMHVEVWDRARIVSEGMGALASVAKGSDEEPRFIVVDHAPEGTSGDKPYVLVGKGLTFDSGGISLKPGKGMGAMKFDMCGAAAVLGAMEAIGRLGLRRHVVGLVAATENMPGGHATKPGDIVTALNGTTIEILNTDAEGRLVLADALSYAGRLAPAAVVDMATLTGAIVVCLGKHAAGLFANDDALAQALTAAGERSGERLWRMPMWPVYGKMTKSDVADIKNVNEGEGGAGSIFGGKFLERFVDYPWAHLDIAGVAWAVPDVPYYGKGPTGFGVRLTVEWLRGLDD